MRKARLSAAMILAAASYLTAGPSVSLAAPDIVVGSNESKTYDCRGGSLTVEGGSNVISLRNCTELIVDGGDNTIDAGVVDAIEVSGGDNKITWSESADGRRPKITNGGEGNVIVSKRAAAGTVKAPAPSSSAPAGAAGAAGKIRIDKDGLRDAYDCRGGSALVNGDRNELSFRNCDQISLNGSANIVAVRAVKAVLVNGDDNKLTWELAEDGSRPRITDNGKGNTVSGKR